MTKIIIEIFCIQILKNSMLFLYFILRKYNFSRKLWSEEKIGWDQIS